MDGKPVRKVAILGVHGIGHHAAGETENAMVDLLQSPSVNFDAFRAVDIQIPLRPLVVKKGLPGRKTPRKLAFLDFYKEQSVKFSQLAIPRKKGQTSTEFTKLLSMNYAGGAAGNTYVTTRLEGKREGTDVHIYEMRWADLARPNSSILSFFLALFQLLLHLASLSRTAIDTGGNENSGQLWNFYLAMQRYAVRMLQIFLPLFKIMLLIVVFSAIPALEKVNSFKVWIPTAATVLAGIALSFLVLNLKLAKQKTGLIAKRTGAWVVIALLPGAAGGLIGLTVMQHFAKPEVAGAIESWIILGAPLLYYVLSRYEGVRKGVEWTGWIAYALTFAGFVACLYLTDGNVMQATFWIVEFVVAAIRTSWLLLFLFALLAMLAGELLCYVKKDLDEQARLRAAVRTSRLALALPAVLFQLLTALIWAGMFAIAQKLQDPYFPSSLTQTDRLPSMLRLFGKLHLIPRFEYLVDRGDYLKSLLVWSVGYQFPITLALFFLAFFLLIWWVLPSALTEDVPLRGAMAPPRSSTNAESLWLGVWLSRGLDATSVVTFLFWCSIFLAPPIFYLWPDGSDWMLPLQYATTVIVSHPILASSGAVIAGAARYGSTVLGVLLDVDTYLRASPAKATPRAKILERYVSTLRYLRKEGYHSVVIVAHSLGALISGDLLLFLKMERELQEMGFGPGGTELKLMTMGNPARQLLNRFFPYLYDWVRPQPDNGLKPLPAATTVPPKTMPQVPDPADLGVTEWVNIYRSGDYVGRSLWLEEWYCRTSGPLEAGSYPEDIYKVQAGGRTEMCIGAGAHINYWNDTAPDVAETLDKLIG